MKFWRALTWLVPIATLIPLAAFAYRVATLDFSAYFSDVAFAGLLVVVGIPNLVILAASTAAALQAGRRPMLALIAVSAIWAWQLSSLVWSSQFWDSHERAYYLLLTAIPGTVAGGLAIWGLLILRRSNRAVAITSSILLLLPVVSTAGGLVNFAVVAARDCPAGPAVDLTFTGLENAHFTTSCGIPTDAATLAGCNLGTATVSLFSFDEWDLQFLYSATPVTSDAMPRLAPYLMVGGNTTYGGPSAGTAPTWKGSYAFDAGSQCSGTVSADLYPSTGRDAGSVHVSGHFAAPGSGL